VVLSPGTVIISSAGEVTDVRKIVEPVIKNDDGTSLIYIGMSSMEPELGGSALGQVMNRVGTKAPTVADPAYFARVFDTIQALVNKGRIIAGHDISAGGMITTLLEMCFASREGGLAVNLGEMDEEDTVKLLFSQNPGIIIQVEKEDETEEILLENGITYFTIGHPVKERKLFITNGKAAHTLDIDRLRDLWYKPSWLLDSRQSGNDHAKERYSTYGSTPLKINTGSFDGKFDSLGISPDRKPETGIKAAIIREKGVNGDREMAYALWLAGFDVKDVHMTDLISGRETLTDISMIVFVGGFSNSDVMGSAKGWAGAFRYNEKAKLALENFYKRNNTLSLGVCNGCQLMTELNLIYPEHARQTKLVHNNSHKFESGFIGVRILKNNSVMFSDLEGMELGIWVAHGEGKFVMPYSEDRYHVTMKYAYSSYPANPNGSMYDIAGLCSADGRHMAMMPHLERAYFPWQCAWYPDDRRNDDVTPWMKAFVNARKWIEARKK